jgi:predicted RNase H-like HicB family nuclease
LPLLLRFGEIGHQSPFELVAGARKKTFSTSETNSLSMKLKVTLEEAEEGGYIVSCPALPGCHSQGDTVEEALENIKEAIKGCLESLSEERMSSLTTQGKIIEVTV